MGGSEGFQSGGATAEEALLPELEGVVSEDGVEEKVDVVVADEVAVEHQHRQVEQDVVHGVVHCALHVKRLPSSNTATLSSNA